MRGKGIVADELDSVVKRCANEGVLVPLSVRTRDSVFDEAMVARLMVGKYKSTFSGAPFLKDAVSRHLYKEIFQKQHTATVIDLGTAFGGSAAWFAHELPESTVVTLDIADIRRCTLPRNVIFLQLDITNSEQVREALKNMPHPWLVSEDCHVPANTIMRVFDGLFEPGDYIVFEDTHPCNPDITGASAESETYVCGHWSTDKLNAVELEMIRHAEFMIDTHIQDFYGYNGATFINSVFLCIGNKQK